MEEIDTWRLLMGYNAFEVVKSLTNLVCISAGELENAVGQPVDTHGLALNNLSVLMAIILLTAFVYRHRRYFTNRTRRLF